MMADYIDRQAAIDALGERPMTWTDSDYELGCADQYDSDKLAIKAVPSTDVQPVVRCKDCIHYMPYDWMFSEVWQSQSIDDYPQNEIGCEWIDHYVKPDDYCSFGEQKGGEQNG